MTIPDCQACAYYMKSRDKELCTSGRTPVPVESARRIEGDCGPDAYFFEEREKYDHV